MTEAPLVVVRILSWLAYWRAYDSATDDPNDAKASAWRGFWTWIREIFPRAYARGNNVIASPWLPARLLAHECAHTPAMGSTLPTLVAPRSPDGGLAHEPVTTMDIMLPGYASFLRKYDSRGIRRRTFDWLSLGKIEIRHG